MTRSSRIGKLSSSALQHARLLTLCLAVAATACAGVLPASARDDLVAPAPRAMLRFDNAANEYVDVYLAAEQRQWRLGRVEPGAKVSFSVPAEDMTAIPGFVRLVVLKGTPPSLQATSDPRATVSIAQPVSELLQQEWTFSSSQASSPQLLGRLPTGHRP